MKTSGTNSVFARLSLRTRIVIALNAFAVMPMLILAIALSFQIDVFKQAQLDRFKSMAIQVGDVIDRNLFERYGDVQAFGYNAAAFEPTNWRRPANDNPLVEAMDRYMVNYGLYKLMILVSPEGNVLAVNSKAADGNPLNTADIYNKTYKDAGWLRAVLANKFLNGKDGLTGTFVDQPQRYAELASLYPDDDFAIVFAAPVSDSSGKVVGVWANFAGMGLVEDIATAAHEQFEEGGVDNVDVTILDAGKTVLSHFDHHKLNSAGKYVRDWNVIGRTNLNAFGAELFKSVQSNKSGAIDSVHGLKKTPHVSGFALSAGAYSFPGLGWTVLLQLPSDQVFSDLRQVELVIVLVIVAALGISAAFGLWFGGSLTRPIKR